MTLVALLGAAPSAWAQGAEAPRTPGSALTVYLLTIGPGTAIWEKFGHNAIWIHDAARGTDVAYDYGRFDFDQEDFLLRFARGRMRYWMARSDARRMVARYAAVDRTVWAQRLNLTPAQRAELRAFLRWNALPQNRYYRYDYYRDNCSTRVRDALDRVLDGAIEAQLSGIATGTTYRSHSRRLTRGSLFFSGGIHLGLGMPADQPLSAWEESFLPLQLREHLRAVTVRRPGGERVPLVAAELTLHESSGPPPPGSPPDRVVGYLLAGLLVAALVVVLARLAPRRRSAAWGLAVAGAGWGLFAGLLGCVFLLLWAATEHTFGHWNLNLLQMSPLALALAPLVPAAVLGGRWRRLAGGLAAALAALSVAGLLLEALTGFDQANGEAIALALPISLAFAWAFWRKAGDPSADAAR